MTPTMTEIMTGPTPITTPARTINLPREANIGHRVTIAIETRTTSRNAVMVCVPGGLIFQPEQPSVSVLI
jgi:hypothetical protein